MAMVLRHGLLWLAGNEMLRRQVMRSKRSRHLARRFVAGETKEQLWPVVAELNRHGASVSVDYLGENVTSTAEAAAVKQTYIDLLNQIAACDLNCNVSVKLTALGLDISHDLCLSNLLAIVKAARVHNNFVRIDMEGSAYTQPTLDLFERVYVGERLTNVGVVIQSYLYRSAADVDRLIELGARVRLCKGAYKEPPEIAYPRKADVDRNYIVLAQKLLMHGNYPGLATHDTAIIDWIKRFVQEHNLGQERYEFQMLYGVRRDVQQQLISEGYNMRVYVPFGEAWYPYLMRRMAERPANVLFVLKALRHR
jgi:proline dehydrogenase